MHHHIFEANQTQPHESVLPQSHQLVMKIHATPAICIGDVDCNKMINEQNRLRENYN